MPDLVKKMVNEGFDKRLSEIESFDRKKIGLEYEQIIKKHQRLFLKDENNLYKKLELIKDIFEWWDKIVENYKNYAVKYR